MYLLIKYIKSVLWRVAKRLSYIEDGRCLKVNIISTVPLPPGVYPIAVDKYVIINNKPEAGVYHLISNPPGFPEPS